MRNAAGSDSDSASLTVPPRPPQVSISCSPSSIDEGDRTTCEVSRNNGGAITTYEWSDSDGGWGSSTSYGVSFASAGTKTVYLTASNSGGSDSDTYRITVAPKPNIIPPSGYIQCDPMPTAEVGSAIRCDWSQTGGDPATSLVWSGGDSSGSGATYRPGFSSTGSKTVRLDVSNSGGSAYASLTIRVVAVAPSSQWSRCGSDEIKVYWFDRTNYQKRHLDITGEQATAIFGLPWWETIRHMSQSACDSWPTGPVLTGRPPSW